MATRAKLLVTGRRQVTGFDQATWLLNTGEVVFQVL
jgi:hypothetical protein